MLHATPVEPQPRALTAGARHPLSAPHQPARGATGCFRPQAEPPWSAVLDWFGNLPDPGGRHAHA